MIGSLVRNSQRMTVDNWITVSKASVRINFRFLGAVGELKM